MSKRLFMQLIVPAAALLMVAAASPQPAASAAKDKTLAEIRDFEERFNKTYESNDVKAYLDFFTDDMTQVWQEGRMDMPEYRKFWPAEIDKGRRVLEVRTADMAIHTGPSNDSAVASYRIFVKERLVDGSISESWNQETDVIHKIDGRWKVVHMHYSDAPSTKDAPAAKGAPAAGDAPAVAPKPGE